MPAQTIHAAVSLIECLNPKPSVLLIQRATHPKDPWSGHLSFPGGRIEAFDPSPLDAAIRETHEECDLWLEKSQCSRQLPVRLAGRDVGAPLQVAPFVFRLSEPPILSLNPSEAVWYSWIDIDQLKDPSALQHGPVDPVRPRLLAPHMLIDGKILWGFTLQVLSLHFDFRIDKSAHAG